MENCGVGFADDSQLTAKGDTIILHFSFFVLYSLYLEVRI